MEYRAKGDATVAVHIYMSTAGVERGVVHGLTLLRNRWEAGDSQQSLLVYTELADRILHVWSFPFPLLHNISISQSNNERIPDSRLRALA